MNYQDIISQVARRLGYNAFENSRKADLQQAISWAETELLVDTSVTSKQVTITLAASQAEYSLPDLGSPNSPITDFARPTKIIVYTTDGVKVDVVEVNYEEWLHFDPTQTGISENDVIPYVAGVESVIEAARLLNRVLVSIRYLANTDIGDVNTLSKYVLNVKPAIDGTCVLVYDVTPNSNVFTDLTKSPIIPPQFHHYIIVGAVAYLAPIEASVALASQKPDSAAFYDRIAQRTAVEFERAKAKVIAKSAERSTASIARAWPWYENPKTTMGNRKW